ncbi:hypothetical protein SAMN04488691_1011210 [Haloferax larsenii]|uniref:Uncharacterized protein n=1 Tax=Haloferax larsenii TaxID=302484 RepID=A0A1H7JJ89_HALLR|nr:hypothetical protein SAMN04488691_1011210 [Haloferax larsenii]
MNQHDDTLALAAPQSGVRGAAVAAVRSLIIVGA